MCIVIVINSERGLFLNVVMRAEEQAASLVTTQQSSYDQAPL